MKQVQPELPYISPDLIDKPCFNGGQSYTWTAQIFKTTCCREQSWLSLTCCSSGSARPFFPWDANSLWLSMVKVLLQPILPCLGLSQRQPWLEDTPLALLKLTQNCTGIQTFPTPSFFLFTEIRPILCLKGFPANSCSFPFYFSYKFSLNKSFSHLICLIFSWKTWTNKDGFSILLTKSTLTILNRTCIQLL